MKKTKTAIPFFDKTSVIAIVGFALYWTWLDATLFRSNIMEMIPPWCPLGEWVSILALVSAVVGYCIGAFAFDDFAVRFLSSSPLACLIACTGSAGTILLAFSSLLWWPIMVIGLILSGLAMAMGVMVWAEVYSLDELNRGSAWAPGSIACSFLFYFAVSAMPSIIEVAIIALMPFGSMMIALNIRKRVRTGSARRACARIESVRGSLKLLPRNVSLLFFGYSAFFGVMIYLYAAPNGGVNQTESMLQYCARGLSAAVFFVGIAYFGWKPRVAYRTAMLIMVAGFLALPFLFTEFKFAVGVIANMGYGCFDSLIWAILLGLAKDGKASVSAYVGLGRLLTAGGTLVGAAVTIFVKALFRLDATQMVALSSSMTFLMVVMLMFVLYDDKGGKLLWGAMDDSSPGLHAGGLEAAVESIAQGCALTNREAEVLSLLAQGRSMPYIASSFHISENTVKSHVRHIYQKASLHNRQELLDRIEQEISL